MGGYAFARSWSREDERLAALERQLDPVSQAAIGQLGLAAGWRCWEAGAGHGSMAAWLADQVTGSGSVLATDIDISGLSGLHRANITVARHDLEQEDAPTGEFDLIHARLVLEHLQEPPAAVGKLASALRAGGWLILEDADGLLFDAGPRKGPSRRSPGRGQRAAQAAGWSPCYGRYLVTGLQQAGLDQVAGRAHRTCQPGGDAWLVARLGIAPDAGSHPARGSQPGRPRRCAGRFERPDPGYHRRAYRHRVGAAHWPPIGLRLSWDCAACVPALSCQPARC